jgi:diguanylate cyclase (GGDEF)-like protein
VVQPIVRLDDRTVVGYEALARVHSVPDHGPDWWLTRSESFGTRTQLERLFLESAVRLGSPPSDALLFVNASPKTLAEPTLFALRESLPERLVVEITEQAAVDDYDLLNEQLEPWMSSGVRIAIDDTGAGYSSLRHVIELSPDFLKLDWTLIHDIDKDSHRHALVRALAAFAREVGTSVIAEGIETPAELAAIMEAGVPLGQGHLLARPGSAWPTVSAAWRPIGSPSEAGPDTSLRAALSETLDAAAACEVVVAHLFRLGQVVPSLYLEHNGRLRCIAQRGLWQVLDGLPPGAGITGEVWASGEPMELRDVAASPSYLEAVPGVVAEICVPVTVDGVVIGALNVDSLSPLPQGTLRHLQDCAALLSRRLGTLGWHPQDSPWQRGVHGSIAISAAAADRDAAATILTTMLDASGMDSAGLVRTGVDGHRMQATIGPLAPTLQTMDGPSLASVCHLVDHLSSCYTGSETTGLPYLGSEILRAGGARAVVLLPLRANNLGLGAMILAHSRPMRLSADLVEPLELLAGQSAATLNAVDLMEQLRHQAHHDGLTGLGNRLALDQALDRLTGSPQTVLIADLDRFKRVNDRYGHVGGDEALRSLASQISAELPSLSFYRMGGDEFLCLFPKTDVAHATDVAEVVSAIGHGVLSRWGTSLSIGLAVPTSGDSPHQTLARADQALLWAKKHARGTVAVSPVEQVGARPHERRPNRPRDGAGISRDRIPDGPIRS